MLTTGGRQRPVKTAGCHFFTRGLYLSFNYSAIIFWGVGVVGVVRGLWTETKQFPLGCSAPGSLLLDSSSNVSWTHLSFSLSEQLQLRPSDNGNKCYAFLKKEWIILSTEIVMAEFIYLFICCRVLYSGYAGCLQGSTLNSLSVCFLLKARDWLTVK